jgi:hypothetical protein
MPHVRTRTEKTTAEAQGTLPSTAVARAPAVKPQAKQVGPEPLPASALNAEERDRLIAQAAYFRAEKRGFAPGSELQDWVEAEADVLRLIGKP